jgi:RecJ-like exonuclease
MNTDRTSKRCGYCKGAKKIKKSRYDISAIGCPICKATGTINIPADYTTCYHCDGTGRTSSGFANAVTAICDVCEGKGWAKPA